MQGVVGMPLRSGNGPTIHETLHRWGVFLDSSFGFGQEAYTTGYTSHWGHASVDGSLGGFKKSSLRCIATGAAPTGNPPACPLTSGKMEIQVDAFEPGASNDTKGYVPLELYLMGVTPASAITESVVVMQNPVIHTPVAEPTFYFTVDSLKAVTIQDTVAKEGVRPAATTTAFRGAYVLVTSTTATPSQLSLAESWGKHFGGEGPTGTSLLSFAQATGNLATMTTRLGPAK